MTEKYVVLQQHKHKLQYDSVLRYTALFLHHHQLNSFQVAY